MKSNPYRPPTSNLADISTLDVGARSRPVTVYISLALLLLVYVQTHVRPLAHSLMTRPMAAFDAEFLIINGVVLCAEIASLLGVFFGRRWARWLVVLNFLMSAYSDLIVFPRELHFSLLDRPTFALPVAISAVAVLLLFLNPGRRWFGKRGHATVA